ncbi:hypothetical protein [Micropruina sp.]|uniref:hypothetical protein n=1 Tax=Micropruina sp. TaxID=2737536 RepID=UPI0039E64531
MTFDGRPGTISAVVMDGRDHFFARDADDSLLHWWSGPEAGIARLGAVLRGDPVAVSSQPGSLDVFALGAGSRLLHWSWDTASGRMAGPDPDVSGRRCAYDPEAVVSRPGRIDVVARTVSGAVRHWWIESGVWGGPTDTGVVSGSPCIVDATGETLSYIAPNGMGGLRAEGFWHPGDRWAVKELEGSGCVGRPIVIAPRANRLDVFSLMVSGDIWHWGWSGDTRWYTPGKPWDWHHGTWYGPDPIIGGPFVGQLWVTGAGQQLDLVVTRKGGDVERWHWDGTLGPLDLTNNEWRRTSVIGRISRGLTALRGEPDVYLGWADAGQVALFGPEWSALTYLPRLADEPEVPVSGGPLPPVTHLIRRPRDLLVLGVGETDPERHLALTFPPQHVAEAVNASPTTAIPSTWLDDVPLWQSALSGPSAIVLQAPAPERVVTADVLEAAEASAIAPGAVIELPAGLRSEIVDGATLSVDASPIESDGVVGLWTALVVAQPHPFLHPVSALTEPQIGEALGIAFRRLIAAHDSSVSAERLRLSTLGADLIVRGRWTSFEWDHRTALGRDMSVRTSLRGVLYPTGHAAEYVEIAERTMIDSPDGPIAALNQRSILLISEATRRESADPMIARLLPFDAVTIGSPSFDGLDDPDQRNHPGAWSYLTREPRVPAELGAELDLVHQRLDDLPDMPGDRVGGSPDIEALADGGDWSLAEEQRELAETILSLVERIDQLEEQIAAVMEATAEEVPWYFVPHVAGSPLRVPVSFTTPTTSLSVGIPVIFVADQDLRDSGTLQDLDTLTHPTLEATLTDLYAARQYGVVDAGSIPIDVVRSTHPKPGDVQIVRRLQLSGIPEGRSFRARLGVSADLTPEAATGWAVDVELPELRAFLPAAKDTYTTLLSYSEAFERVSREVAIALELPHGQGLAVDFAQQADRVGGLVTPSLSATAISREFGLVNAAAFAASNPREMVDEAATLLGVRLRDLLPAVGVPPSITSVTDGSGRLSTTVEWHVDRLEAVPVLRAIPHRPAPSFRLRATVGVALPAVRSHSAVSVPTNVAADSRSEVICTVSEISISLPPAHPLLELQLERVEYRHVSGMAPVVDITNLRAAFHGELDLLQSLQEKVGLGGALPMVETTADGIMARYSLPVPDVAAGAFSLRGISFNAAITVPFRGGELVIALGFATRDRPFALSVLLFGGGGYVVVEFAAGALRRIEICLEFGAMAAVNFGIAKGEAHILGGIRYELVDGAARLTGFIRVGGSLEVLGLVSVSVELLVELGYETTGNRLVGRATLCIELDLTLWSDTLELDSGEWVISGGDPAPEPPRLAAGTGREASSSQLDAVRSHRRAFA